MIHSLTCFATAECSAHEALEEKDDEDDSSAPTSVKKGISHISKAMQVTTIASGLEKFHKQQR
jgi:hypothetical protein